MFIVQLGLLVCMASQGHLHQKIMYCAITLLEKLNQKNPIQFGLNLNSFTIILFPFISMISTSFVNFEVLSK
jgi:hypothetical protein